MPNAQQDEANNYNDLGNGEDKFRFAIFMHSEEVDSDNNNPKDEYESGRANGLCTWPERNRDGSWCELKRKSDELI